MSASKIIFLDFDGVLNSKRFLSTVPDWHKDDHKRFDPTAVKRLNHILDATAAQLVISSSWRYKYALPRMRQLLEAVGVLGDVLDVAPARGIERVDTLRWKEIEHWLGLQPQPVSRFIILEDEEPMGSLEAQCIRTTYEHGLLDEHVERAVALLTLPAMA